MSHSKVSIHEADLFFAATSFAQIKQHPFPEIAVFGRTNVGKSTFINRMSQRKKLARTSATPGRTQEFNFFKMRGSLGSNRFQLVLTDVPGFGYAKISKSEREGTEELMIEYIRHRNSLSVVCLLNDVRRDPEASELAIRKVTSETNIPLLVIATKFDQLRSSEKASRLKAVAHAYSLDPSDILTAGEGLSTDDVWSRILEIIK